MKINSRKNRIFAVIIVVICVSALIRYQISQAHRVARITPEYTQLSGARLAFVQLGGDLKDISSKLSITNDLKAIFAKVNELDAEIGVWTSGSNPLPDFLPDGNYGRLYSWKTNCSRQEIPILWRSVNWREGVVVYLALSGDVRIVKTNEFSVLINRVSPLTKSN